MIKNFFTNFKSNEEPTTRRYENRPSTARNHRRSLTPPTNRNQYNQQQADVCRLFDADIKEATRTLFVGNLDNYIDRDDLKQIFSRFGLVEEIDIKRTPPQTAHPPPSHHYHQYSDYNNSNNNNSNASRKTYAFVKYLNMDMAMVARFNMNGKKLGSHMSESKVGYGNNHHNNNEHKKSNYFLLIRFWPYLT